MLGKPVGVPSQAVRSIQGCATNRRRLHLSKILWSVITLSVSTGTKPASSAGAVYTNRRVRSLSEILKFHGSTEAIKLAVCLHKYGWQTPSNSCRVSLKTFARSTSARGPKLTYACSSGVSACRRHSAGNISYQRSLSLPALIITLASAQTSANDSFSPLWESFALRK